MTDYKPFSIMFNENKNPLKPIFFDIHVLERYFNNPKFILIYSDYRGSIALKDEYFESEDLNDYEQVRNFGLAYKKSDRTKRAIVVFAEDLKNMPSKIQAYWYTYYLENQDDYYPNQGFVKNLIYGQWVDNISIYSALLMEMHYINKMCECIGLEKMFREEFKYNSSNQEDIPIHYHVILYPTRDNYYNFITTLEKLVINNLNYKTFILPANKIFSIDRYAADGKMKGTLRLLEEWLDINVRLNDTKESVINNLKHLRKLRQKPAHELYQNEYDEEIWENQNHLMHKIYTSVRNIRLLFANHPLCNNIEIPDYLFDGKHIATY